MSGTSEICNDDDLRRDSIVPQISTTPVSSKGLVSGERRCFRRYGKVCCCLPGKKERDGCCAKVKIAVA